MSGPAQAHPWDPSNPNDPRNWNGYLTPTFTVPNIDPNQPPIIHSSFTLAPLSEGASSQVSSRSTVEKTPLKRLFKDEITAQIAASGGVALPATDYQNHNHAMIQQVIRDLRIRHHGILIGPPSLQDLLDELELQCNTDDQIQVMRNLLVGINDQIRSGGPIPQSCR